MAHLKQILKAITPPILLDCARGVRRRLSPAPQPILEGMHEIDLLGLHWRLDMSSLVSRAMAHNGIWEAETTSLVKEYVKPGMKVISVGANFGYYAVLMAQYVGPGGHVWAFEPTRKFRAQLEWHVKTNGFADRVTIVPYGLSDAEKTARIDLTPQSASMHGIAEREFATGSEVIELKRLDDKADELGIDRIDFVSMDIDGHEPSFLQGADKILRRNLPPIAMEISQQCLYFAGSDARELALLLQEIGYEIHSEKDRKTYASEYEFLKECGNFDSSPNILALPRTVGTPVWKAAWPMAKV